MSEYLSNPYEPFGGVISIKLDLSKYATKPDLKGAAGVDMSNLAAKLDLPRLMAEAGKIHVDKLKTVPVDLSKLSNVVNNGIVKKSVYDKLVAKVVIHL